MAGQLKAYYVYRLHFGSSGVLYFQIDRFIESMVKKIVIKFIHLRPGAAKIGYRHVVLMNQCEIHK